MNDQQPRTNNQQPTTNDENGENEKDDGKSVLQLRQFPSSLLIMIVTTYLAPRFGRAPVPALINSFVKPIINVIWKSVKQVMWTKR